MTSSSDFPTTIDAYDRVYNGLDDAFVTKLNATGSDLEYSTFLGGIQEDYGYSISIDGSGRAFVIGQTRSSVFPQLAVFMTARTMAASTTCLWRS